MNRFNNRFNIEDEEVIFRLHGKTIATKKIWERLWGLWYYETEEEAQEIYNELREIVGDRCITSIGTRKQQ